MQKYILHSTCNLASTLELIRNSTSAAKTAQINGLRVKVSSLRLKTFAHKGVTCAECGLVATYFALEKPLGSSDGFPFHLNLYGTNTEGIEVLFTHDHILARCLGGKDSIENTQPMCSPCNGEKGKIENVVAQFQKEVKQFNKKLQQYGKILNLNLETTYEKV